MGNPKASHPIAAFNWVGSLRSLPLDTYADKTLCVQEIISGKYILLDLSHILSMVNFTIEAF